MEVFTLWLLLQTLSKALVNIAYGLNQSKELKDMFIDLVERVIEPCRSANWSAGDMETFLYTYQKVSSRADIFVK